MTVLAAWLNTDATNLWKQVDVPLRIRLRVSCKLSRMASALSPKLKRFVLGEIHVPPNPDVTAITYHARQLRGTKS